MNNLSALYLMSNSVLLAFSVAAWTSIHLAIFLPKNYKAWALAPLFAFFGVVGNPQVQLWIINFFGGFING